MSYVLTIRGPVLFASWTGLQRGDLESVRAAIARLRAARSEKVVYVSRIPSTGSAFSEAERAALTDFLCSLVDDCASIHHVIEGEGFLASARRATVINMALATTRPRIFHAHASVAEAAAAIHASHGVDLGDLDVGEPAKRTPASATRVKSVRPHDARASSAFRAASRIAGAGNPRKR